MNDRLAAYLTVLGLDDSSDAHFATGQFHDVVLAGDVAYRFPRDEVSRRRLPTVTAILSALGEAGLPAAIPVPVGPGRPCGPLGECHVPLTRLLGQSLGHVSDRRAQEAVIADLAMLMDRLAELGEVPAIANLVPKARQDDWPNFARQVQRVLYPLMSAHGRQRADAELAAVTAVTATGSALVHTDLGGANLLWTTTGGVPRLTGILDWDEACIGNQASDLASIAVTIGWPLAQQIDIRRRTPRPLLADAKIIASTFALQQALPAALNGDHASLDEGLNNYR